MQDQDYRHCPGCGGFIDPDDGGNFPEKCPHCGWEGKLGTPEEHKFSDVYGSLDGTGGEMTALANAVHAAQEAGHHLETTEDRLSDANFQLQQAFDLMDEEDSDVDAGEVLDHIESAHSFMSDMHRGMPDAARDFEIPDHVDSGVYDTLARFADYVLRDITRVRIEAEEWAELAE